MYDDDPTMTKVRAEQKAELEAARTAVPSTLRQIKALLRDEFGNIAMREFDCEDLELLLTELAERAASHALSKEGSYRLADARRGVGSVLSAALSVGSSKR